MGGDVKMALLEIEGKVLVRKVHFLKVHSQIRKSFSDILGRHQLDLRTSTYCTYSITLKKSIKYYDSAIFVVKHVVMFFEL